MDLDIAEEYELSLSDVEARLPEIAERVSRKQDRVLVTAEGQPLMAMIPVEDLAFLRRVEDLIDSEAARAALEEWERTGRKTKPMEQVMRELGLDK